jgi:hypothetical protein
MYLINFQILKDKKIFYLFTFSLLARIISIFTIGDTSLENEWSLLVSYLTDYGKLYSIFPALVNASWIESSFIISNFENPLVPNVFMPPLYAFYLYLFKFLNLSNELYILTILFSQAILSTISVIIFYNINKIFFSEKVSFFGSLIFSFFPLHIYACAQISSVILQSFLLILFFYLFFKISKTGRIFDICFLSLVSGLLILLRGEFIALFVLSILYLSILKIKIKNTFIILFFTFIVISPYIARNIILLDKVTITKSVGYNLWKGNNSLSTVEGNSYFDTSLGKKISNVSFDNYYDINVDKVFQKEALKNIKNNPIHYLKLYIAKFLSFIFIDINSTYPNYYNPTHYIPVLLIGITSVIGIILSDKKSLLMNFLILFFLANISLVSIFFILPRYTLATLPLQIIFSNIFFSYIKNNFFKKL